MIENILTEMIEIWFIVIHKYFKKSMSLHTCKTVVLVRSMLLRSPQASQMLTCYEFLTMKSRVPVVHQTNSQHKAEGKWTKLILIERPRIVVNDLSYFDVAFETYLGSFKFNLSYIEVELLFKVNNYFIIIFIILMFYTIGF